MSPRAFMLAGINARESRVYASAERKIDICSKENCAPQKSLVDGATAADWWRPQPAAMPRDNRQAHSFASTSKRRYVAPRVRSLRACARSIIAARTVVGACVG